MSGGIKHKFIDDNQFKEPGACSLAAIIPARVPGSTYCLGIVGDGLIPFPQKATDAERKLDVQILAREVFREIYEDIARMVQQGRASRIHRDVLDVSEQVGVEEMANFVSTNITGPQAQLVIARYLGLPLTVEQLQSLERIFAGGVHGALVYLILAKARNVDGVNPYASDKSFGRETTLGFTGSSSRTTQNELSGAMRIYSHGDKAHRALQQKGEKLVHVFAFGSFHKPLESPEPGCAAAFSLFNFPDHARLKGFVLLVEEFMTRATHSIACGVLSEGHALPAKDVQEGGIWTGQAQEANA